MEDIISNVCLLRGYTCASELEIDDKLTNTAVEISKMVHELPSKMNIPRITNYTMKKSAKRFMLEKFNMHDIGYFPQWLLLKICYFNNINSIEELIDIYNRSSILKNPFDLPIKYVCEEMNNSALVNQLLDSDDEKEMEFIYKNSNVYYRYVKLPKISTTSSTVAYVHEITHTQIDSYKRAVVDFINREVLSIFLELLYAKTNGDLFNYTLFKRIDNFAKNYNIMCSYKIDNNKHNISKENYYWSISYVNSVLKAFKMLYKYINGSEAEKEYILIWIQEVFNGKMTVEDCLEKIGVTLDNSIDIKYTRGLIKEK